MEKKKLIGTIIGVIAFIALIAGATFAWFTYNITLNNAGYNFTSSNFSIVYDKGSNITGIKMLSAEPSTITTGAENGEVTLSARTTGTITGTMTVYLNVTTGLPIINKQALKSIMCVDSTDVTSSFTKGTVTVTNNVATLGTVPVNSTLKNIYVMLWLDATKVDETLDGTNGQFSGYISASATQTQ